MRETEPYEIDETALHRRADGEEARKVEILSLFLLEAPRLLERVRDAGNGSDRRLGLLAMAKAARGVEALRVATVAQDIAESASVGNEDLAELTAAVEAAIDYITSSRGGLG